MPYLRKQDLSSYITTECKRRLHLSLSPDNQTYRLERTQQGMPPREVNRPGFEQITQAGVEWEETVLNTLHRIFTDSLIGDQEIQDTGQVRYREINLIDILPTAVPGNYLIESQYEVTTSFETNLGVENLRTEFNLKYARVRPDIIEVLPPHTCEYYVTPIGDLELLNENDTRIQLRIIDIKLSAEPSPGYFAEIVYYSMILTGWLIENNLDNRFVVIPEAGIWSGSHQASSLITTYNQIIQDGRVPTDNELRTAIKADIEIVPFEVFAFRVRRFLQVDIPDVLGKNWREHDWHVDNRCKHCEYLGYPWRDREGNTHQDPDHCMPMAEAQDHLSRIAFMTRGARAALQETGITNVHGLANVNSENTVFNSHQTLRATRTVIPQRARSLENQEALIPQDSGTSAIMPRWADLRIYVSVDFDVGSGISFAFGVDGFWLD